MASPVQQPGRVKRFGVFELDPTSGELRKKGILVRLPDQPFKILTALLERPGEVVTRDELARRLWPDGTFVDFDGGLNAALKNLRRTLEDNAENPRFIETLPRHGYRFIAPVESSPAPAVPFPAPPATDAAPVRWRPRFAIWAGAGAAVAGVLLLLWLRASGGSRKPMPPMKTTPLTSYPGAEISPSFSPDGGRVAFAWNGDNQDNFDIYVRQIGTEAYSRLTTNPAPELDPAWSPDGKWIAFRRESVAGSQILRIPAIGGAERKLADTEVTTFEPSGAPLPSRLSWSPDCRFLAFSETAHATAPGGISVVDVESREIRKLTVFPAGNTRDLFPAFSPDGGSLAFTRDPGVGTGDIWMQRMEEGGRPYGKPWQLTRLGHSGFLFFDWSQDGRSILIDGLRRIPISGGEPEALDIESSGAFAVSRQGNRLVYVKENSAYHLYRVELVTSKGASAQPARYSDSTLEQSQPAFSGDGSKVAFCSLRSGAAILWVCEAAGTNCRPLDWGPGGGGSPWWSPDGQKIAFDSARHGTWDIFVIDEEGGLPRRMTTENSADARPRYSRDGKWIYFGSDRSGDWQVWKLPSEGGTAVRVTRNGGFEAQESSDGKFVYYAKRGAHGIWRVPADGGEETLVTPLGQEAFWTLRDGTLYLLSEESSGLTALSRYDLSTGLLTRATTLPMGAGSHFNPSLAVSPDGRTVLYSGAERPQHDLILVENFR